MAAKRSSKKKMTKDEALVELHRFVTVGMEIQEEVNKILAEHEAEDRARSSKRITKILTGGES